MKTPLYLLAATAFVLLAGPAGLIEASFTCQAVPGSSEVVIHSDRCEADVLALQGCTPGHSGGQSFFDRSYLDEIVCSADGNLAFPEQEQTYLRCFGVSCSCSCRRAPAPSYMVANGTRTVVQEIKMFGGLCDFIRVSTDFCVTSGGPAVQDSWFCSGGGSSFEDSTVPCSTGVTLTADSAQSVRADTCHPLGPNCTPLRRACPRRCASAGECDDNEYSGFLIGGDTEVTRCNDPRIPFHCDAPELREACAATCGRCAAPTVTGGTSPPTQDPAITACLQSQLCQHEGMANMSCDQGVVVTATSFSSCPASQIGTGGCEGWRDRCPCRCAAAVAGPPTVPPPPTCDDPQYCGMAFLDDCGLSITVSATTTADGSTATSVSTCTAPGAPGCERVATRCGCRCAGFPSTTSTATAPAPTTTTTAGSSPPVAVVATPTAQQSRSTTIPAAASTTQQQPTGTRGGDADSDGGLAGRENCGPAGVCGANARCAGSCDPPGPCASVVCVCNAGFAGNGYTCAASDAAVTDATTVAATTAAADGLQNGTSRSAGSSADDGGAGVGLVATVVLGLVLVFLLVGIGIVVARAKNGNADVKPPPPGSAESNAAFTAPSHAAAFGFGDGDRELGVPTAAITTAVPNTSGHAAPVDGGRGVDGPPWLHEIDRPTAERLLWTALEQSPGMETLAYLARPKGDGYVFSYLFQRTCKHKKIDRSPGTGTLTAHGESALTLPDLVQMLAVAMKSETGARAAQPVLRQVTSSC